ncbi:hypothetical protein [Pseudonocardia sp. TMWB2A]|uniref:hypothetical protein n=1 Tax=Pseudonocardia sp. TMWB2A TaxID=687430 RepID=UPI00307E4C32
MGADPSMWGGQWDFVWAAYALTFLLSALVLGGAYLAMRRAEARADALRRSRD